MSVGHVDQDALSGLIDAEPLLDALDIDCKCIHRTGNHDGLGRLKLPTCGTPWRDSISNPQQHIPTRLMPLAPASLAALIRVGSSTDSSMDSRRKGPLKLCASASFKHLPSGYTRPGRCLWLLQRIPDLLRVE